MYYLGMTITSGSEMYRWATQLFPLNRSLTGDGVRETLNFIKNSLKDLQIFSVPSGTKAFDWTVPNEWSVKEAWIADLSGNRIIDFQNNNLHCMGYSTPVDRIVKREELERYLHSLPDQPDAIPYVTSYYKEDFGFCLSQNQRDNLGEGPFHIFIDSKLFEGHMNFGELYVPGDSSECVLFSTYICHPSLANNELSGPVVTLALAKHVSSLTNRRYSYRFIFNVETIGTIYYISQHLQELKKTLICGWVLTCLGDEKNFSYLPTRMGDTLTDLVSRQVLRDLGIDTKEFSWLDRGSDERQYNAPGVDLPVGSMMRTKYCEYPEYHTSLDDLNFISADGLEGGLDLYVRAVEILETNFKYKINVSCEPQLSKRGLFPNLSTKNWGGGRLEESNECH
jgi:aminopeptidase-like protein